jgi:amino acid adenylation domain-containing protein
MGQEVVGFEISAQQSVALCDPVEGYPHRTQVIVGFDRLADSGQLRAALDAAVARFEVLRTTFVQPAGAPVPFQMIHPSMDVPLTERHVARGPDDPEVEAVEAVEAWGEPLTTDTGPVLRARALRYPDGTGTVILTALSAVADAASLRSLASTLGVTAGEPDASVDPTLDDQPLQYADYAAWQAELRVARPDGVDGDPLRPEAAPTALPSSASPTPGRPGCLRPEVVRLDGAPDLAAAIADISGGLSVDPVDVWVAIWATLAGRLTGSEEVTVGLASDGRDREELVGAVGPFTRTLPLSLRTVGHRDLRSLTGEIRRLRQTALDAADRAPLVVSGQHHQPPALVVEWRQGGGAEQTPPESQGAQLTLVITEATGSTAGGSTAVGSTGVSLWSDPGRITEAHAEQVALGLTTVATELIGRPAGPPATVAAPGPDGSAAMSAFLVGPPQDRSLQPVHLRFEEQARRHPERSALSSGDRTVTFGELDRRANRLARLLIDHGAVPNHPVAIVMDRSVEQVVAVLAVLKAGAAHLCLNPDQPPARMAAQLEHAGPEILLTTSSHAGDLPAFSGAVLQVDQAGDAADTAPPVHVGLDDLAYLIYTSGSTGTPKGVAVTHRSLANYVGFVEGMLDLDPERPGGLTFGLVASLSTDLGNTCLYPSLVSGGLLDLVPLDTAMDPAAFAAHTAGRPIDVLKITPSHLDALLAAGAGVLPRAVLITGGEGCTWDLVDRVQAMSDVRVINHYGPSECTVGSLVYEVGTAPPHHRERPLVPIGRPIADTWVTVADDRQGPTLPGEPGELLIGGAGVARSYWRADDRTAEAFVTGVDRGGPGDRLYRTGDLARVLADGTVEFLGRLDGQVKVRGYRVETGEIEAALRQHREVQHAAVVLRTDRSGDPRLVGYIVSPYSPGPSPSSLREFLREKLPEYMVPVAFVELDSLPLGAGGKLDRSRLPVPSDDDLVGHRTYLEPSTDTERAIAAIYADLLGVDQVGADDDFFALGGHSLLATQAIARIRRDFAVDLEVHLMFTEPTVSALSGIVDERRRPDEDAELAELLREIDSLTDEEAEALLAEETGRDLPP